MTNQSSENKSENTLGKKPEIMHIDHELAELENRRLDLLSALGTSSGATLRTEFEFLGERYINLLKNCLTTYRITNNRKPLIHLYSSLGKYSMRADDITPLVYITNYLTKHLVIAKLVQDAINEEQQQIKQ